MTPTTLYFDYFRKLVQDQCGVNLENDREYLVESMVQPALEQWQCPSINDLVEKLKFDTRGELSQQVSESLVPNETYFFRDPLFFEGLQKKVLPDLIRKNFQKHQMRIWCAACSSGQEPYSLLMMIKEKFPFLLDWDFKLIATDFSQQMLTQAREGLYNQTEVQRGLPEEYLEKYFNPEGNLWQVREDLRNFIDFRQVNLKTGWLDGISVDLLLMRNVLIYFDPEMKKELLLKASRTLDPEGYLFLGSSETALFLNGVFDSRPLDGNVVAYKSRRLAMGTEQVKSENIELLIRDLWSTLLGLDLNESSGAVGHAGTYTAWVRIIGNMNLAIILRCHEKLAQRAAAIMFDTPAQQVRPDQVTDSLKELVNILGGNIKGMAVKYHFLSLPSVSELGHDPNFPGGEVAYEGSFNCDGLPLSVKVLRME